MPTRKTPGSAVRGMRPQWATPYASLVAELEHATVDASGLPARLDTETIIGWDFGNGTSASYLGGTHAKSLHTGPDGQQWLFKHDSSGGARAAAEAEASTVFAAVGLPAVPVYRTIVGGNHGSVQPLLSGAVHFPASPGSWTQVDVDAIVRYHVGTYAVSNHDGHPENLLRASAGGMVAIDLGQAFKHCHEDALSLSYNPVSRTVPHSLYRAHLAGALPAGVKLNVAAAYPVLTAFERIPDAQWRVMLHDTAHTGAKAGMNWTNAMRGRAAAKHGIAADNVTTEQIADAFLDAAVQRKQGLRQSFTDFFAGELNIASAPTLLKAGH
ncbi:hypothetical protein ABZS66_33425 [Dactylosporangium sp. NPDC005572]|uniref:hypothetical protein n=1 Tax=Dactylosporangium sp. NPDC005572 TaxID=3156889 RepID=UPI0033ADC875